MKILIAQPDATIARSLKQSLASFAVVDVAYTLEQSLFLTQNGPYDCIVLDMDLATGGSSQEVASLRTKSQTPMLMLTASDHLEDKLGALQMGADDYLPKPFCADELCARLQSLLRRCNKTFERQQISFGDLHLDLSSRTCTIGTTVVPLGGGRLFDLTEYLVRNAGSIVAKRDIFHRVWGYDSETTLNVVEVYVSILRKTLRPWGYDRFVHTVRSRGYLLCQNK